MSDPNEQFRRIELLTGPEGLARLRNSFIVLIGLGAVGSYALEALARAGIGRIRFVDFDSIKPSNINRQLLAYWHTIDRKKTELALERVRAINPACVAEPLDIFVHHDTINDVLSGSPDFVIDAIDSLNPKTELMVAMANATFPAVSCLGAALRTDPLMIKIAPLAKVTHCPLGAMLRKRLRKRGIDPKFPCIFSNEPVRKDPDSPEIEPEPNVLPRGRLRLPLGSLPTIPGIFGLIAANMAIKSILAGE